MLRGAKDLGAEDDRETGQRATGVMITPHIDALTEESPEPTGNQDIFLIHMHEDRVVVAAESPRKREETPRISNAIKKMYSCALRSLGEGGLTERMYAYILGERILPFFETNHFYFLNVF